MERNYGAELDALKEELEEIKKSLALLNKVSLQAAGISKKNKDGVERQEVQEGWKGQISSAKRIGHIHKMENVHPDPSIQAVFDNLENDCGEAGDMGRITYLGVFSSGGRQSGWIRHSISAEGLLELIENRKAERVLSCIGNNDRLNILLALLKKPMTVAQLVKECGYNSTGQVYHHLNPLLAADLLTEDDRNEVKGCYMVQPHRVQGIIMLLAGISDMLDPSFTQGNWSQAEE